MISPPEVRLEEAAPRVLAAARGRSSRAQLGGTILRLLDLVWPVVRSQGVRTDHNVVLYVDGLSHIEAGVETFGSFQDAGDVRHVTTPAGPVATVTHWGDYSEMEPAYAALQRWCADNGHRPAGPSWEVYGDWADDARERRTDIYVLLSA